MQNAISSFSDILHLTLNFIIYNLINNVYNF